MTILITLYQSESGLQEQITNTKQSYLRHTLDLLRQIYTLSYLLILSRICILTNQLREEKQTWCQHHPFQISQNFIGMKLAVLLLGSCNYCCTKSKPQGGGWSVSSIFRQHAASIYGFVRFVRFVRQKKKFRPLLSKVGG